MTKTSGTLEEFREAFSKDPGAIRGPAPKKSGFPNLNPEPLPDWTRGFVIGLRQSLTGLLVTWGSTEDVGSPFYMKLAKPINDIMTKAGASPGEGWDFSYGAIGGRVSEHGVGVVGIDWIDNAKNKRRLATLFAVEVGGHYPTSSFRVAKIDSGGGDIGILQAEAMSAAVKRIESVGFDVRKLDYEREEVSKRFAVTHERALQAMRSYARTIKERAAPVVDIAKPPELADVLEQELKALWDLDLRSAIMRAFNRAGMDSGGLSIINEGTDSSGRWRIEVSEFGLIFKIRMSDGRGYRRSIIAFEKAGRYEDFVATAKPPAPPEPLGFDLPEHARPDFEIVVDGKTIGVFTGLKGTDPPDLFEKGKHDSEDEPMKDESLEDFRAKFSKPSDEAGKREIETTIEKASSAKPKVEFKDGLTIFPAEIQINDLPATLDELKKFDVVSATRETDSLHGDRTIDFKDIDGVILATYRFDENGFIWKRTVPAIEEVKDAKTFKVKVEIPEGVDPKLASEDDFMKDYMGRISEKIVEDLDRLIIGDSSEPSDD